MTNFISPVFFATLISSLASILTTIFLVRLLIEKTSSNKVVTVTIFLIVLISYPFAWFLGYVIGGNFGGAIASIIPVKFLSNVIQISIGIGIGIFACTIIVSILSAIFGFILGRVINIILKK